MERTETYKLRLGLLHPIWCVHPRRLAAYYPAGDRSPRCDTLIVGPLKTLSETVHHQPGPAPIPLTTITYKQGMSQWKGVGQEQLTLPDTTPPLPSLSLPQEEVVATGQTATTAVGSRGHTGGGQRVQGTSHVDLRHLQEPRLFIPWVTLCDFEGAPLADLARGRVNKVAMHPGKTPSTLWG